MSSPTSRTLEYERSLGNTVGVTEYWHAFAKIRKDLFNCIDVVVLDKETCRIRGVQVTSGTNHKAREKKALEIPAIKEWLECGGIFQVQSWKKVKNRWPKAPRISQLGKLADGTYYFIDSEKP